MLEELRRARLNPMRQGPNLMAPDNDRGKDLEGDVQGVSRADEPFQ